LQSPRASNAIGGFEPPLRDPDRGAQLPVTAPDANSAQDEAGGGP
jgi:hypothetical protein